MPPNLPLAPHPRRKMTADPSRGRNVQPLALSPVRGLAPGLDQLLKIRRVGKGRHFSL